VRADYAVLREWQTPVVAVDRVPRGLEVDLVDTDNREGARVAVEHLFADGHRLVGLINGPEGFAVTRERLTGYAEALAAAGVELRSEYVVHSDFRRSGGKNSMEQLLNLPQPPRAVLVANNLMTLGALEAIHERGVRVPQELALVCFDDMPWATSLNPPLTAVAQPAEELGRTAAELLLERLRDPQRIPRRIILPNRLVVRSSCGHHPERPIIQPPGAPVLAPGPDLPAPANPATQTFL
jgi:DNA-binding LacI/PurR family transcriptional regulator